MMVLVPAILGGIGFVCTLYRRSLLGLLIGIQLMFIGATSFFVMAGVSSNAVYGHVFGFFIVLVSFGQLVTGYAIVTRSFRLKNSVEMENLKTLRQ